MCGIIAILLSNPEQDCNSFLFDGLTALQHRGQDAAGIVTCKNEVLHMRKMNGLVRDVFDAAALAPLIGPLGIGHCRYPTAGTASCAEAQPLYTNSPFGICLAHNGNLTNVSDLRADLRRGARHLNTDSDSEVLLNVFAMSMLAHLNETRAQSRTAAIAFAAQANGNGAPNGQKAGEAEIEEDAQVTPDMVFSAVSEVMRTCKGGYTAVAIIVGAGIVAFRDPWGIRPLIFGRSPDNSFCVASESVALDTLGFDPIRDVSPGEGIFLDLDGHLHTRMCHPQPILNPCMFELVYLARPDSVLDGVSVYQARLKMGSALARRIKTLHPNHDIDVVVPVPDTGRIFALELAHELGVPYREALTKNRYIPRTFIMPGQSVRRKGVRLKLNTIRCEIEGKAVLLVDDSVVRGNTSEQLVALVRAAGAAKVYFASAAPPVSFPNVYGIDMPTRDELIASKNTHAQVASLIGADFMYYQVQADMEASVRAVCPHITQFDTSCFDGQYVTGDIDLDYLSNLASNRNEERHTTKRVKTQSVVEIHNKVGANGQ